MPLNEINKPWDEHPDHIDKKSTRPNSLDLLRLTSSQSKEALSATLNAQDKGKHPTSPEEEDLHRGRAVGEDGNPVPRTVELTSVSTLEKPILPGGMRRRSRRRGGDQTRPSSEYLSGNEHQRNGRYNEALAQYSLALARNENDVLALGARGDVYRLLGRYDEALADLNKAITLDGNNAWAIGSRGQTYQAMGRSEEALADFERALVLDSSLDWARRARGEVQQELDQARGQLREAEERMRQSSQKEENRKNSILDKFSDMRSLLNTTAWGSRQYERGQSSRGDLRVDDALPTTLEGIEEQLEREQRIQQESRARELQLRERMERTLWEQRDLSRDDRLSRLLQQRIRNVLSDHRLREELFPDQQHIDRLRESLRALHREALDDHRRFELGQRDITFEFLSQVEEQIKAYNRPEEEFRQVMKDVRKVANEKGLFRGC